MAETLPYGRSMTTAGHVLGRKLDSIPFSPYHLMILGVLGLVGFIDGYDLVMTGSLLVLAKHPLHMTPAELRFLTIASTLMICVGGFIASTISDHFSRKTIMLIGVGAITFCTLLIPLVQNGEQLIALRLLTGLGGGFAVSAPFPIAAELMPAQHRRTFGAIYEMSLAASFTALPVIAGLFSGHVNAFRMMALPGGLAFFIVPALIYLLIPESPRWYLRHGRTAEAVDTVNRIIRRAGGRVPELTIAALGNIVQGVREQLPPYRALFGRGQLRWMAIGISSYVFCGTAFFLISVLLPKALVDQGAAVGLSFGVTSLVFAASIPGKGFTGFLMEIIGRRWTIFYAMFGALPGILLMMMAHRAGQYATIIMVTGALMTGFTTLSAGTAFRIYLAEQFPTGLRGRGHIFSESVGRIFSGVAAPFLMEPYVGSPVIFFGTI
ncbi:MAG: MFS transporter, partial [Alphaproteobacteria bacterium]|nr:MFS transporter [Alphaproteobacteria bacterium]